MLEELLPYYNDELHFLRQMGKEFAAQHREIAARLEMEGEGADPHVDRLVQSFAFLSARIHKKLADEFPQITDAFLSVLYPHILRPIPSTSIVQFALDPGNPQLTQKYHIPRLTPLYTRDRVGAHDMPCTFRTCYDVDAWPIQIVDARVEPIERTPVPTQMGATAVVRLKLGTIGDLDFADLAPERLRFFIDAERGIAHTLHELILNSALGVALITGKDNNFITHARLEPTALKPVGFAIDEGAFDYDARTHMGYRLLLECFACPDKFLFFDLEGLSALSRTAITREFELVISLGKIEQPERLLRLSQVVGSENFKLACTPVVNLFRQFADPIRITGDRTHYPVVPDERRKRGMEVSSITRVEKSVKAGGQERVVTYHPFFSIRHGGQLNASETYWYATRVPSQLPDDEGTDIHLALVDLHYEPSVPEAETLSVTLTCTNRDLPASLEFGGGHGLLNLEGSAAVSTIRFLRKPTASVRVNLQKGSVWRLISHLSLNHSSLTAGGPEALQEMLRLYNFSGDAAVETQIARITALRTRQVTRRIGSAIDNAFVRGTEVEIEFDQTAYTAGGLYLLALILEQFMGLYCAPNSFVQFKATIKPKTGKNWELATWPPRSGAAPLI